MVIFEIRQPLLSSTPRGPSCEFLFSKFKNLNNHIRNPMGLSRHLSYFCTAFLYISWLIVKK